MKHTTRKFSSASPLNMKSVGAATQKFIISLILAAVFLCQAVLADELRPLAAGERPAKQYYEHPLGENPSLEATPESVRQMLIQLAEWFIDRGYPDADSIRLYRRALEYGRFYSQENQFSVLKYPNEINPHTGLPAVGVGVPRVYGSFNNSLSSPHDFIVQASVILRESAGLVFSAAAGDEMEQLFGQVDNVINLNVLKYLEDSAAQIMANRRIDRLQAIVYLAAHLKDYPYLTKFLTEHRSFFVNLVACSMAVEYIEGIKQAEGLDWAVKKGLFDPAEVKLTNKKYSMLLANKGDNEKILAVELESIGMEHLIYWLTNDLRFFATIRSARCYLFFFLSQMLAFSDSGGAEGFNPKYVEAMVQARGLPLEKREALIPSVEAFYKPASAIMGPVNKWAGIFEERVAQMDYSKLLQENRPTPSREDLLAEINKTGEKLTLAELDYMLDKVFPGLMVYIEGYHVSEIKIALYTSGRRQLINRQIDILIDYILGLQVAKRLARTQPHRMGEGPLYKEVTSRLEASILRPRPYVDRGGGQALAAGEKDKRDALACKRAVERFVEIMAVKLPSLHDKVIAFLGQERFKTMPPSGRTQVEGIPREIRDEFQDLLLSALGTPEASGIAEFAGMRQLALGHITGDPKQTKDAFLDMLCANGYFLSLRKIKYNQNGWVFPDLPSWSIDEIVDMGVNDDEVSGRPVPATVISVGRPIVTGLLKEQEAAVGITDISIGGHPLIVMSDARIRERLDDIFELRKWICLKGKAPLPDDVVKRYILLDHTLDLTRFALLQKEWPDNVFGGYMDSGGKERFINEHFPSYRYLMFRHEKVHILADSYGANPEQSEILACLYDVGGPEWQGYSYRWLRLFLLVEKVKGGVGHEALHDRAAQYILFEALPQIAFSTTDVDAIAMLKVLPNLPNSVLLGCLPVFERLLFVTAQKAMATRGISKEAISQLEASI